MKWLAITCAILGFSIYSYDRVEHSSNNELMARINSSTDEINKLTTNNKVLASQLEEAKGRIVELETRLSITPKKESAPKQDDKQAAAEKVSS